MINLKNHTDVELLIQIKLDNKEAFSELYDRFWDNLYNNAYKRIQDEDVCKDIVQDVFIDIWVRRNSLEIENVAAYLNTAIRFQCLKFFAKNKYNTAFTQTFDNIIDASQSADHSITEKEVNLLLAAWLEALPDKRRLIYQLHFVENLSTKQISAKLNISQKTVQNQLGNATKNLRERIAHLLSIFF
jgi:RNA polymerase sigma-70 factor (ECF subfamily)